MGHSIVLIGRQRIVKRNPEINDILKIRSVIRKFSVVGRKGTNLYRVCQAPDWKLYILIHLMLKNLKQFLIYEERKLWSRQVNYSWHLVFKPGLTPIP